MQQDHKSPSFASDSAVHTKWNPLCVPALYPPLLLHSPEHCPLALSNIGNDSWKAAGNQLFFPAGQGVLGIFSSLAPPLLASQLADFVALCLFPKDSLILPHKVLWYKLKTLQDGGATSRRGEAPPHI